MPSFPQTMFPTLQSCMDLARSLSNDMYPGIGGQNGRILTNDNPKTINFINAALRKLNRDMRNLGATYPIVDNFIILDLPPVNPTNDPSVEVYIGFNGYFDGTTLHGDKKLPGDLLQVETVESRTTGSNLQFAPMYQPQSGLPSAYTNNALPAWRWAQYKIFMIGANVAKDVRLQYLQGQLPFNTPPADFSTTNVFILDSEDAMGAWIAYCDIQARGGDTTEIKAYYADALDGMETEWVRRQQGIPFRRQSYQGGGSNGDENDSMGQTMVGT